MDILILIKNFWITFICSLPDNLTSCVLRMATLLALALIFLSLSWRMPQRSVFLQLFVFFMVINLAMCIPIQNFIEQLQEWQRTFCITTAFLCMIFIPNFLPFLLNPIFGNQIKIKKFLLFSIWGLFLLQLILAR